jgi:hypothetical protein
MSSLPHSRNLHPPIKIELRQHRLPSLWRRRDTASPSALTPSIVPHPRSTINQIVGTLTGAEPIMRDARDLLVAEGFKAVAAVAERRLVRLFGEGGGFVGCGFHEEGVAGVEGGEVVDVTVQFFCKSR